MALSTIQLSLMALAKAVTDVRAVLENHSSGASDLNAEGCLALIRKIVEADDISIITESAHSAYGSLLSDAERVEAHATEKAPCPNCKGTGLIHRAACPLCHGAGALLPVAGSA